MSKHRRKHTAREWALILQNKDGSWPHPAFDHLAVFFAKSLGAARKRAQYMLQDGSNALVLPMYDRARWPDARGLVTWPTAQTYYVWPTSDLWESQKPRKRRFIKSTPRSSAPETSIKGTADLKKPGSGVLPAPEAAAAPSAPEISRIRRLIPLSVANHFSRFVRGLLG